MELLLKIINLSEPDKILWENKMVDWCKDHKEIPFLYYNIDKLLTTGIFVRQEYSLFEIMDNFMELSFIYPSLTFEVHEFYTLYVHSTFIKNVFHNGKVCKIEGEIVYPEITDDMFKPRNTEMMHVSPRGEMYVL